MQQPASRRTGVLIPLFSIPSSRSWGIGEIGDLHHLARWVESAGLRFVQLLPINEMPPGETSPYSALSAMALDPQFITIERIEDFAALGGEERLEPDVRARLDALRASPTVQYEEVRALKNAVLRRSFAHFRDAELATGTRRAAAFRAYIGDQAWWLDDYALYRALHAHHGERPWSAWPEPLRTRQPDALSHARVAAGDEILYRQYLQWIADDQWADARRDADDVGLFGDLPFVVGGDSADVWARQDEFRLDASLGVPPDAFSDAGQDWGLPVYRWDVVEAANFGWFHERARRYVALFDGYRVDHVVGFYRTYFRPHDGSMPAFTPTDEGSQLRLGERVLEIFRSSGADITVEDLGIVPDLVRASIARLGIPGYKVLRWERHWHIDGQPFRDPVKEYPAAAVATTGTHDTEPMVVWWETAPREERAAVLAIPSVRTRISDDDLTRALEARDLPRPVHEALIEVLLASGANLAILPVQDIFAWPDRINRPASISTSNWVWRLPWPSDRFTTEPVAMAAATQLNEWTTRYRR